MLSDLTHPRHRAIGGLVANRRLVVILTHALLVSLAYFMAFALRFDLQPPNEYLDLFKVTLPLVLTIRILTLQLFRLHEGLWRYVSLHDLGRILAATTLGSVLLAALAISIFGTFYPDSILLLDWMLSAGMIAGSRIAIRTGREFIPKAGRVVDELAESERKVLLIGAGDAGDRLLREVRRTRRLGYRVVGVLDDDTRKSHSRIRGVPILGTVHDLPRVALAKDIEEVVIAIPSAGKEQRRRIMAYARVANVPVKSVPGLRNLVAGRQGIEQLHDVMPEDVLARAVVNVDAGRLRNEIDKRSVLVTGAGGSIGSELSRQVALLDPERLVMFERAESDLYFSVLDVKERNRSIKAIPCVGDITNTRQLETTFQEHQPDIVYHAAAYKHVPLMEVQPLEAIENNVFGSERVALAARKAGVNKFVLISTDKAVRPVSIMGMSKRIAECLLLSMQGGSTSFVAVRFGNVLGSAGSVLPLFEKQLARGGPITLTHPDATRFFMLVAEAVQLVMQAGAMGRGGEVFFLDMGDPVKIQELAESFIRLSGYLPGHDMSVETIGLRPGERLSEELVMKTEELLRSEHDKIFKTQTPSFDRAGFLSDLEVLRQLVESRDGDSAADHLKSMTAKY